MTKDAPSKKGTKKGMNKNKNTNFIVKRTKKLRSNWLDRWRAATKSKRDSCCISGCKEGIETCIRVEIQDGRRTDTDCYLPVCKEHSKCNENMTVGAEVNLAVYPSDEHKEVVKKEKKEKTEKKDTKKESKSKPAAATSKKRTNANKKGTKK